MAKRTKKVGTAGRFQARYGVRARSRVRNIEQQQKLYDDYKKLYDIMRPGWDSDDY